MPYTKQSQREPEEALKDVRLMADFTAWYCRAHHKEADKHPIVALAFEGVSEDKRPAMCDECAEFLRYSEQRSLRCRQNPKPFCTKCSVHCYAPKMREYSRAVMRYSGPRSMFSRHAFVAIKHLMSSKQH